MAEKSLQWRGMEIIAWRQLGKKEILDTPRSVLDVLESIGLPVRVYFDHILQPELAGILAGIIKKNNEKVIIKIQLLKTMRRSANEYRQIIMGNNVQLEIPVLD
jgi:hypothetical protein